MFKKIKAVLSVAMATALIMGIAPQVSKADSDEFSVTAKNLSQESVVLDLDQWYYNTQVDTVDIYVNNVKVDPNSPNGNAFGVESTILSGSEEGLDETYVDDWLITGLESDTEYTVDVRTSNGQYSSIAFTTPPYDEKSQFADAPQADSLNGWSKYLYEWSYNTGNITNGTWKKSAIIETGATTFKWYMGTTPVGSTINGADPTVIVQIWESDGGWGKDDLLSERAYTPSSMPRELGFIGVPMDGVNNKAELYVRVLFNYHVGTTAGNSVFFKFYHL